jgi:hypothetical protein
VSATQITLRVIAWLVVCVAAAALLDVLRQALKRLAGRGK